jgi:hypothetical protein
MGAALASSKRHRFFIAHIAKNGQPEDGVRCRFSAHKQTVKKVRHC